MRRRRPHPLVELIDSWVSAPQPIERLVLLRVLAPLAVLGFMSSRIVFADHWIGDAGFSVPDLGGDWRQPMYLAPLSSDLAWLVAVAMVVSGVCTILGVGTRTSALTFAATLAYVALADRLASFTVSKLSPVVMFTIAMSAAGARYGVGAWWTARRAPSEPLPTHGSGGPIRFIQFLLPTFYCASGLCKGKGDWTSRSDVLFTHLHDSYQTVVSHFLANVAPPFAWSVMQHTTFIFELLAPLWFGLARTRPFALAYGVGMHVMIGLMFGPVKWFSMLMIALLLAAYLPEPWLLRLFGFFRRSRPPISVA